jgi:aconitase B
MPLDMPESVLVRFKGKMQPGITLRDLVHAGKEIPMGKRVWESPPVPTVSGSSMRFSQEWITPSPAADLVMQSFCHTAAYPKPVDVTTHHTLPDFIMNRGGGSRWGNGYGSRRRYPRYPAAACGSARSG